MKLLLYLLLIGGALSLAIAAQSSSSPASTKKSPFTGSTTTTTVSPKTLEQLIDKVYDFVTRGFSINVTLPIWDWESLPADKWKGHIFKPTKDPGRTWTDGENGGKTFPQPPSISEPTKDQPIWFTNVYENAEDIFTIINFTALTPFQSAPIEDIYENTLLYGKIYAELTYIEPHYTFQQQMSSTTQDSGYQEALNALPNTFNKTTTTNYSPYQQFTQKYGNLFINRFSLGGAIHLQAWISPNYYATKCKNNETELMKQLMQKFHHDAFANASEPVDLVDAKNQNNIGYRLYGGNTALTNISEWRKTIHNHWTIIGVQFTELDSKDLKKAMSIEMFRYTLNRFRNIFEKSKGFISTMFPDPFAKHNPDVMIKLVDDYLNMKPFPDPDYKNHLYARKVLQIFIDYIEYTMSNRNAV